MSIMIPISYGELIDKITILELKIANISDPQKLANVQKQFRQLAEIRDRELTMTDALVALVAELKTVNQQLWNLENELRSCEQHGDFGDRFVELARSVYRCNDQRSLLKRRIDVLLGSAISEEKFYLQD